MREIDKDYGSDYIKKKEAVRNFLKNSQVNPWSKAVVLGVQVIVLILLYQVFIGGLNAKNKFEFMIVAENLNAVHESIKNIARSSLNTYLLT